MTTDLTPDQLDEWRWGKANLDSGPYHDVIDEYRRLVREGVTPGNEPDQDTLDTRLVLCAAYNLTDPLIGWDVAKGELDARRFVLDAKAILAEIKARVRREAINDLPDELPNDVVDRIIATLPGTANSDFNVYWAEQCVRNALKAVMSAVKLVYGQ